MHSSKQGSGDNNGDKDGAKRKDFQHTNTSSQKKQDSRENTYCVPCKKTIPSGYMCGCEVKSFCEKNPHLFGKK